MYLVQVLNPAVTIVLDFEEEFEELRNLIVEKEYLYERAGGWDKIDELGKKIAFNLSQHSKIVGILKVLCFVESVIFKFRIMTLMPMSR